MPFQKKVDATLAPATETPVPAIDIEMIDGSVFHAVFETDADANAWLANLQTTSANFVGARDADGDYTNFHVANIKTTKVVGVALPANLPPV